MLVRRPSVLVGLMLLAVGTPEVIIGHTKAQSYRARREALPPRVRRVDPTELYPKPTAADERRAVIEGKIGYYELLESAGRILVLLGAVVVLLGTLRSPRPRTAGPEATISP